MPNIKYTDAKGEDTGGKKLHFFVHASVGKVSFSKEQIEENTAELISTLNRLKPAASKGTYMLSLSLSSTMGPGILIDQKTAVA